MKPTSLTFNVPLIGPVRVWLGHYDEGQALAVDIIDDNADSEFRLSVNLPDQNHLLGKNEFFAKTYSENELVASFALQSGHFRDTGRRGGFIHAPIWQFAHDRTSVEIAAEDLHASAN